MSTKCEFLGNGYYCFTDENNKITYDPLLLADFADVSARHLDLCCGNGIIALLMHKKGCGCITGIDFDEKAIELAKSGSKISNCDIEFLLGNVRELSKLIPKESFDSITVNPPYFRDGIKSKNTRKNEIRSETSLELNECLNSAAFALKKDGRLYLCHRFDRCRDVEDALKRNGFYLRKVRCVADSKDKDPFLILFEATKFQTRYIHMNDLILKMNGEYTAEAKRIFFPEKE